MGIPIVFQTPVTVPLQSRDGRLCKGTVKESNTGGTSEESFAGVLRTPQRAPVINVHANKLNWAWNGLDTQLQIQYTQNNGVKCQYVAMLCGIWDYYYIIVSGGIRYMVY